jgi:DNA-binding GntR family transcriptional regulator
MAPARPLEVRSVADQVYAVLLQRIVSGAIPAGSHLRQEPLADELGVSRTPLREALRRLSSEGFVEFAVNHGAAVTDRNLSDPRAAWNARFHLEPATARIAAEIRDPDGLELLERALERGAAAPDVAARRAADADVHTSIAAVTANLHLRQFAGMLWMPRYDPAVYAAADGLWSRGHAEIVSAIARGDGAAAERLSREHVAAEAAALV